MIKKLANTNLSRIQGWLIYNKDLFKRKILASFLGIPTATLDKFYQTGYLPGKWANHVDNRILLLIQPIRSEHEAIEPILRLYVLSLVAEWKRIALNNTQTTNKRLKKVNGKDQLINEGKQQQILDSLKVLQTLLIQNDHDLYRFIYTTIEEISPGVSLAFSNKVIEQITGNGDTVPNED